MDDDFYAILGVARSASQDEIKRAYRKLARELHPDANPDKPEAEDQFKRVTLAYEVLSDPDRRRQYDTFGIDGLRGSGAGGPGDVFGFGDAMFSDLFESLFSGFGGAPRRRSPQGKAPGADLETMVDISFEQAVFGTDVDVPLRVYESCDTCEGTGAKPGTKPVLCSVCDGAGEVRQVRQSILGQMVTSQRCPQCGGLGEEIPDPCASCKGDGRLLNDRTRTLAIPAGVDNGFTLRITGAGHAGLRGGPIGDLYVLIRVQPHNVFRRDGANLLAQLHVPVTQAILGAEVAFETLDGTEPVTLERGTQTGDIIRLKHKGVPSLEGRRRGDLFIELVVDVPKQLTAEEDALVRNWAQQRGEDVAPPDPGLISKIKSAFS